MDMINYEFALKHQLENLSQDYSQEKLFDDKYKWGI
jgi:hypothetical protein